MKTVWMDVDTQVQSWGDRGPTVYIEIPAYHIRPEYDFDTAEKNIDGLKLLANALTEEGVAYFDRIKPGLGDGDWDETYSMKYCAVYSIYKTKEAMLEDALNMHSYQAEVINESR